MNRMFMLMVCLALSSVPVFADSILIGAPGNPLDGDCAPFGCVLEYQQVYGSGLFSGVFTIGSITFFNKNFVPGSIASANYTISLSTTSAAVNGLDATFANNVGADNQVFFSGTLGGFIGPTNQFAVVGTPFSYDPSLGNLLLSIVKDGGELDFSVFLDFASNAPPGTFSRAYSFGNSGVADFVENGTGLVTEFSTPVAVPVPEPASVLLSAAISVLMMTPGRLGRRKPD